MIRVLLAAMLVCLAPLAASADTPEVLKVSAMKVQFVPVVDYAATVEGLAAKKLDLVWYGGFTSVQAVKRTQGQATRLAMRKEDAEFKSVFVARKDGPIKSLADLKGKTFAFGSVSSTSGHLMPRYFLLKNGLNPERHFGQKPAFSGGSGAGSVRAAAPAVDAAPGAPGEFGSAAAVEAWGLGLLLAVQKGDQRIDQLGRDLLDGQVPGDVDRALVGLHEAPAGRAHLEVDLERADPLRG
jgi:ABC-type phosphate/phosphonate transport system substrate-binding protein